MYQNTFAYIIKLVCYSLIQLFNLHFLLKTYAAINTYKDSLCQIIDNRIKSR